MDTISVCSSHEVVETPQNCISITVTFFFVCHHFYSPAQLERVLGFTLCDLLNKPLSQASSLPPPGIHTPLLIKKTSYKNMTKELQKYETHPDTRCVYLMFCVDLCMSKPLLGVPPRLEQLNCSVIPNSLLFFFPGLASCRRVLSRFLCMVRPLLVHIRGAKEFLAYFRALEQVGNK